MVTFLLITCSSAIYLKDSDNLLSSQSPEEQQVSDVDMFTYSTLLSDGENISGIKKEAEDSAKPKPLDYDTASALYTNKILKQYEVNDVDSDSLVNSNDKAPEVAPKH